MLFGETNYLSEVECPMTKSRGPALRAIVPAMATLPVLLGAVAMIAASPVEAKTLNVNNQATCNETNGNPNYCTIKTAVTKANPGDTVLVAAGTYVARVLINRSGTSSAPINVTTNQGAVVTSTTQGFDLSGASWVNINGFTVSTTTNEGIRCTLCSNVNLTNNTVDHSNGKGILITTNSSDMVLTNNTIQDSRLTGIDVVGSQRITINDGQVLRSGLRISTKTYKGIRFSGASDSTVDGTEVADNSDSGIYMINSSTGIRIKNVRSHDNARGFERAAAGIESRTAGNIVESSTAYSNEDTGINMRWGGNDGLIVNNTSYSNGDHGIDILQSINAKVVNNSVYNNRTAGINVEGSSTGATIMNNISVDNGPAPLIRTWGQIRVTTTSVPGTTANYNLVFNSTTGGPLYHWNGVYFSKLSSLKTANQGVETNGLQGDPLWVNRAAGNFHLTSSSGAIDSANSDAISTPEIDKDSESNARCDESSKTNTGSGSGGAFYDRGAFEFDC